MYLFEDFTLKIKNRNWSSPYCNERGEPNERTPITHPYSYDGYVQWQSGAEATASVYSDRLHQWDSEKYDKCAEKHLKDHSLYNPDPVKIQAFLSDYFGEKIELVRIMNYCNMSSGYPVWRFDYKTGEKKMSNKNDYSEAYEILAIGIAIALIIWASQGFPGLK